MEELVATSWQELQDYFFAGAWNPALGRHRSNFAFRGMGCASDDLLNSFHRTYGDQPQLELNLLRNFRKYARLDGGDIFSQWDWLSLAQHHGLPTRLLDWTYSPFVALHFATANIDKANLDGVVWCVDFVEAHKRLPEVLRRELEQEGSNVFTTEMLAHRVPDLRTFDGLSAISKLGNLDSKPEDLFLLFFEPPSLDDRIVNQFALFSVMPNPTATLEGWIEAHPDLCRRIIVKADLKWEVRDRLDQANITERVLFPGLDGLCAWLKRYYLPNPHGDTPNITR